MRVMKHSLLREAVALSSAPLQEQVRITSVRGHIFLIAPGVRWIRWSWPSSSLLSMKQPGAVDRLLPLPAPGRLALNWCLWEVKSSKVLAFSHPSPAGLGVPVGWASSQRPEHPPSGWGSHPGPRPPRPGWLLNTARCPSYPFQPWPPGWVVASLHGLNKAISPLPRFVAPTSPNCDAEARRLWQRRMWAASSCSNWWEIPPGFPRRRMKAIIVLPWPAFSLLSLKLTGSTAYIQIPALVNLGVISSNDHLREILVTLKSWIPMFPAVIKAP